ncbi:universal stress protein [Pontibacter qinzhouensis]|uniref:Universal stress protein n=1 Tax=Pontibacter qinzhouensis TaxID=2603253 RepID=A0A5C8KAD2_9BACT|nr:universal stress protein [Pontibacter qinzhouensis]TXK49117.1 universal stress protein [Pontibacter qinzhouensis]
MKKILCPTDFSKTASKAVEYAAAIAGRAGAHLTLMHVVHLPVVDTSETALIASELLQDQIRDASEKMQALLYDIEQQYEANRGAFTCDFIVKESLLTDIAEHLTSREGYDLVVMGTTGGGSALEELLIGSNAEAVINQVRCPVLTIPASATQPDISKIVYASDYVEDDKFALQQVLELARLFNATVDVIHVVKEATPESKTKSQRFWEELQQAYPQSPLQFQEVVSRHRQDGIKAYYNESGASLVAILRKDKGFFEELFSRSLAEKMTYKADVPLLVLHTLKH